MWVEASHADEGLLDAELSAGVVDEFYALDDAGFLDQVAGLTEGHVGGDMDDADVLVGQHHGVLLGVGEGGIYLGVAVVVVTSQVEGFLVKRGGDGAVDLVGHGEFDGLLDVLEGGVAALGLYLSEAEGLVIDDGDVDDVDGAVFKLGVLDLGDGVDLKGESKQANCLAQYLGVAGDEGAALLVGFGAVQGADGNLGSDACGVAHGDG